MGVTGAEREVRTRWEEDDREGLRLSGQRTDRPSLRGSMAETTPVSLISVRRGWRAYLRGDARVVVYGVRTLRSLRWLGGIEVGISMRGRLGLDGPSWDTWTAANAGSTGRGSTAGACCHGGRRAPGCGGSSLEGIRGVAECVRAGWSPGGWDDLVVGVVVLLGGAGVGVGFALAAQGVDGGGLIGTAVHEGGGRERGCG